MRCTYRDFWARRWREPVEAVHRCYDGSANGFPNRSGNREARRCSTSDQSGCRARGKRCVSADRTDLHQVKISLAFPVPAKPKKQKQGRPQPDDPSGPSMAPYAYNPVWRARYNICVADARDREDTFRTLRLSPPEVYCLSYADAFVPRTYAEALLSRPDVDSPQLRPDLDAPALRQRRLESPAPRSRGLELPLPRAIEPPSQQPRPKSWW